MKLRVLVTLALVVALMTMGISGSVSAKQLLSIAATGQASSFYAYHVAVAQLLNNNLPDVDVTVLETGGSVDNLRLLKRGQADWGQFAEPDFYEYFAGVGPWEGNPSPDFRVFWLVNPLAYYIVVNKDMGIETLSDLDGKAFNPGGTGSATERMTMELFDMVGVHPKWYRAGYSDSVAAMKDRRIAGYMKSGPVSAPDATILDVSTSVPIDFVNWTDDEIATIKKKYPYYDFISLDRTPYGIDDVRVRSIFLTMGTTKNLSEDLAYKIIKTVNENVDYQAESYPGIKGVNVAELTLEHAQAPLHAGVVRYLRELGYDVPDRLVPPEAK